MSTTSPPTPPTDDTLYTMAVTLVNAMLDSASTEVIKPVDWWDRARSALETAAASSTTYAQCVARMAKKLQVDILGREAVTTVVALRDPLDEPAAFAAFRRLATRDAVFIVALARAARDERKAAVRAAKADRITVRDVHPDPEPALFGEE